MKKLNRNKSVKQYNDLLKSIYPTITNHHLKGLQVHSKHRNIFSNNNVRGEILDVANIRCPYCNFTDILKMPGNSSNIDHFLPRSRYAKKAIQFKNLIPCCSRCNNKKGIKIIPYSPDKKNFEKSYKIRLLIENDSILAVNVIGHGKMKTQIETLKLNVLFNDPSSLQRINERYAELKIISGHGIAINFEVGINWIFKGYC